MPIYRVANGHTFGRNDKPATLAGPGQTVELSEYEAAPLLGNVLEGPLDDSEAGETAQITDEQADHIERVLDGSVRDVLQYIESGGMATAGETAAMLLEAERAGQGRVTLIRELEALASGAD